MTKELLSCSFCSNIRCILTKEGRVAISKADGRVTEIIPKGKIEPCLKAHKEEHERKVEEEEDKTREGGN